MLARSCDKRERDVQQLLAMRQTVVEKYSEEERARGEVFILPICEGENMASMESGGYPELPLLRRIKQSLHSTPQQLHASSKALGNWSEKRHRRYRHGKLGLGRPSAKARTCLLGLPQNVYPRSGSLLEGRRSTGLSMWLGTDQSYESFLARASEQPTST